MNSNPGEYNTSFSSTDSSSFDINESIRDNTEFQEIARRMAERRAHEVAVAVTGAIPERVDTNRSLARASSGSGYGCRTRSRASASVSLVGGSNHSNDFSVMTSPESTFSINASLDQSTCHRMGIRWRETPSGVGARRQPAGIESLRCHGDDNNAVESPNSPVLPGSGSRRSSRRLSILLNQGEVNETALPQPQAETNNSTPNPNRKRKFHPKDNPEPQRQSKRLRSLAVDLPQVPFGGVRDRTTAAGFSDYSNKRVRSGSGG